MVLMLAVSMLLAGLLVDLVSSRPITAKDILLKATAYVLGAGLATILLRTDRLLVEITDSTIRGPVRKWLWFTSIEAPLTDVYLPGSRMSFWQGSFIRLRTGEKIILSWPYIGMRRTQELFSLLEKQSSRPGH